jgi:hypothetical protein
MVQTSRQGSMATRAQVFDSVLVDLSAGGLVTPCDASGSRLGCEAKGADVAILRVSCWPRGRSPAASGHAMAPHPPARGAILIATWPWLPRDRRRNDHVHHPCPYVKRLAGLVMYVLAW